VVKIALVAVLGVHGRDARRNCYDVFACMAACGGDAACFAKCQKPDGVDYCVP